MPLQTDSKSRKEKRKRLREQKKGRRQVSPQTNNDQSTGDSSSRKEKVNDSPAPRKRPKTKKHSTGTVEASSSPLIKIDDATAAALERDDTEISYLESKMGLKTADAKKKLNKEYAKLEGFGDDFGDFLEDLDGIADRLELKGGNKVRFEDSAEGDSASASASVENESDSESEESSGPANENEKGALDVSTLAMIERDEKEIAYLEKKMGLKDVVDRKKLNKEYARHECFGEDFGDFLHEIDEMTSSVMRNPNTEKSNARGKMDSEEDDADDIFDDDSISHEDRSDSADEEASMESGRSVDTENEPFDDDEEEEEALEDTTPDHDIRFTYQPKEGEDIYGRKTDDAVVETKPDAYVPPHARKNKQADDAESVSDQQQQQAIQMSVNRSLNRLSGDTLISVSQALSLLYASNPTAVVDMTLWKSTKTACIEPPMIMAKMIPVFVACLVGVHLQTRDTVQLAEEVLEYSVTGMWNLLEQRREQLKNSEGLQQSPSDDSDSKAVSNYLLIVCYLYNYGVIHCSFMYGVIRNLLEVLTPIDIECLLLLLTHCGSSLRGDDPSALKEIVLLVQQKAEGAKKMNSSNRINYMISAILDLKNNKRKAKDSVHAERVTQFRKQLGRIKSLPNVSSRKSDSSLRISLEDILQANTKGRWWKVGASWIGNQTHDPESRAQGTEEKEMAILTGGGEESTIRNKLLKQAAKFRMNTEKKRDIFCIIMGATDYDDAFENLCRGELLQNRNERDVVRVIIECCGQESSYNQYYGHLASQICTFQQQSKFSFQLAFWDCFKSFESAKLRRVANLAKLLVHLVVKAGVLRLLSVIKVLEMSGDDIDQSTRVFLTIVFSDIFDHYDEPREVKGLFLTNRKSKGDSDETMEGIAANTLVFLLETLKASPKNVKGTKFSKNFKAAVKALDVDGLESML